MRESTPTAPVINPPTVTKFFRNISRVSLRSLTKNLSQKVHPSLHICKISRRFLSEGKEPEIPKETAKICSPQVSYAVTHFEALLWPLPCSILKEFPMLEKWNHMRPYRISQRLWWILCSLPWSDTGWTFALGSPAQLNCQKHISPDIAVLRLEDPPAVRTREGEKYNFAQHFWGLHISGIFGNTGIVWDGYGSHQGEWRCPDLQHSWFSNHSAISGWSYDLELYPQLTSLACHTSSKHRILLIHHLPHCKSNSWNSHFENHQSAMFAVRESYPGQAAALVALGSKGQYVYYIPISVCFSVYICIKISENYRPNPNWITFMGGQWILGSLYSWEAPIWVVPHSVICPEFKLSGLIPKANLPTKQGFSLKSHQMVPKLPHLCGDLIHKCRNDPALLRQRSTMSTNLGTSARKLHEQTTRTVSQVVLTQLKTLLQIGSNLPEEDKNAPQNVEVASGSSQ